MPEYPGLLDYLALRLGAPSGVGPEYAYHCPFCIDRVGDESDHKKLRFNANKVGFCCFRCGFKSSDLAYFFKQLNGGKLQPDEERLIEGRAKVGEAGVTKSVKQVLKPRKTVQASALKARGLPVGNKKLAPYVFDPLVKVPIELRKGIQYLVMTRKIARQKIVDYDIRYCPDGDHRGYLIFPIRYHKKVVYYSSRATFDTSFKQLNVKNIEGCYGKTDCLFNFDACVGCETIALAEGPISCMAFDSIPACGLNGKTIAPAQVILLRELVRSGLRDVVLALDPDAETTTAVYRAVCDVVPSVRYLKLLGGDPDDCRDQLDTGIQSAKGMTISDRVALKFSTRKKRF